MTMRLVTNSVPPSSVRETDDAWVIENVPIHKPLDQLDGGYTPRENVKRTAGGWHGVPVTLSHPRDDTGTPIAAHREPERFIGEVRNPEWDGETVRVGELEIRKADLDRLGQRANAVKRALNDGEPLQVSSQYSASDLPPGEYDGEFRSNAARIDRPDSVAIVTAANARCSIEDGCGINPQMAANADVTVPMTDDPGDGEDPDSMDANARADGIEYDGTAGGELDESEIPTDDFEAHYVFDGDTKTASSFPLVDADGNLRRGNVESAFNLRGHAPDTDALLDVLSSVNDAFDDPPIDAEQLDEAMSANAGLVSNLRSFLGLDSESTTGADTPTDADDSHTMDDTDKIDFIVANSDFDRENVVKWEGEDCLGRLYEQVKANADADGGDGTDDSTTTDVVELTEDELMERFDDRLDALAEEKAEAMVANQQEQSEKDDLASAIVANSAEYDSTDDVLEDYPTVAALETKRDDVTAQAGVPGTGATAQFAANAEDDDLTEDLSAGVF